MMTGIEIPSIWVMIMPLHEDYPYCFAGCRLSIRGL